MKTRFLIGLTVLGLAACQGAEVAAPNQPTPPSLAISDGAHPAATPGNPDFFFLPPIVLPTGPLSNWSPNQFNPSLALNIVICQLNQTNPALITPATKCKESAPDVPIILANISGADVKKHFPSGPEPANPFSNLEDLVAHYHAKYQVINTCTKAYFLRVRVLVGSVDLGFADVQCVTNLAELFKVDYKKFGAVWRGALLQIPVRTETNALCPGVVGGCVSASIAPTEAGTVLFGGTPSLPEGGVTLPVQDVTGVKPPVTLTLTPCVGPITGLRVFGSCLEITSSLGEQEVLTAAAKVFICDVLDDENLPGIGNPRRGRVHLHRQRGEVTEALENESAGECGRVGASNTVGGMLRALAHGEWKTAGKQFAGLLAPQPLYARRRIDVGAGGRTKAFSKFQFAEEPARVLIYGPSLGTLGTIGSLTRTDNEETLAIAAGYIVTVATAATWATLAQADFAKYQAIVFGDPTCLGGTANLAAADANKATWSAVATGPAVVIGTDPQFHAFTGATSATAAKLLITNGINYAASGTATGLYVSLSCYYAGAAANTPVSFLSEIGPFAVTGQFAGSFTELVTIDVPGHPVMSGLTSASLSNWGNSVHEAFSTLSSFPTEFSSVATVARSVGVPLPYIIVR